MVGPDDRTRLAELLLNDAAYLDRASACTAIWVALITFEHGTHRTEVRLCFGCGHINFNPGGTDYMGTMEGPLIEMIKRLFPKDEVFQSL